MKTLVLIPARGGSKGIPRKNIKNFCGKPLIYYSIDIARNFVQDVDICVSTDDEEIIEVVQNYGLVVPFKRPDYLATDTATTNDTLMHALRYYNGQGINYDIILLLQPTSPLRTIDSVRAAIDMYSSDLDMVVSVKKSHAVSTLCRENRSGFIESYFNRDLLPRQAFDSFYEYTGSIYVINVNSLISKTMGKFINVKKIIINELESIDIDNQYDWILAESIVKSEIR